MFDAKKAWQDYSEGREHLAVLLGHPDEVTRVYRMEKMLEAAREELREVCVKLVAAGDKLTEIAGRN